MEPTYYLILLRRRWRLLLLITAVGVLAGLASSALSSSEKNDQAFYAATNTLIADVPTDEEDAAQQALAYDLITYYARLGQVPDRVAEQVGGDPIRLASRISITPVPSFNALEVTATGTDPDEVVELADAYAVTLVDFLTEKAQADRDDEIAKQEAEVEQLQQQYDSLGIELASGADPVLIEEQQADLLTKLGPAKNELEALQASPKVPPALSVLEPAEAVEIGAEEYAAELASIAAKDSDVVSARDAQINAARSSSGSAATSPILRAGMGGALGLIAGIILVLILDRIDARLHTREEVEEAYGLPVLAEIPMLSRAQANTPGIVSFLQPRSRFAESFRLLRSALLFAWVDSRPSTTNGSTNGNGSGHAPTDTTTAHVAERQMIDGDPRPDGALVILISSPGPSEGKTTATANLAVSFAEAGYRVLALNCDYRRPRLHDHFEMQYEPRRVLPTRIPEVFLVADVVEDANSANPAEVVAAQREIIATARDMFDIILVDTAPLLTTNDAAELLPVADLVVMAARSGRTTHDAAYRSAEMLERRSANAVGAFMVAAETGPAARYYYYYRGRYYHDSRRTSESSPPRDKKDVHVGAVSTETPADPAAASTSPPSDSGPGD